jgi:hypothetical protein
MHALHALLTQDDYEMELQKAKADKEEFSKKAKEAEEKVAKLQAEMVGRIDQPACSHAAEFELSPSL